MLEFYRTPAGRSFFETTMPRIAKALETIAGALTGEARTAALRDLASATKKTLGEEAARDLAGALAAGAGGEPRRALDDATAYVALTEADEWIRMARGWPKPIVLGEGQVGAAISMVERLRDELAARV